MTFILTTATSYYYVKKQKEGYVHHTKYNMSISYFHFLSTLFWGSNRMARRCVILFWMLNRLHNKEEISLFIFNLKSTMNNEYVFRLYHYKSFIDNIKKINSKKTTLKITFVQHLHHLSNTGDVYCITLLASKKGV